jgi:hypothetical protein
LAEPIAVSGRFPYLTVKLDVGEGVIEFEALVDTGFEGDLAVSTDLVGRAAPIYLSQWLMANGARFSDPTYDGTLQIGGITPLRVTVVAVGGQPVLGRGVLDRFLLILDHGREVRLDAKPLQSQIPSSANRLAGGR